MAGALDNFRKKYPQYGDMQDADLALSILKKFPDYRDALGPVAAKGAIEKTSKKLKRATLPPRTYTASSERAQRPFGGGGVSYSQRWGRAQGDVSKPDQRRGYAEGGEVDSSSEQIWDRHTNDWAYPTLEDPRKLWVQDNRVWSIVNPDDPAHEGRFVDVWRAHPNDVAQIRQHLLDSMQQQGILDLKSLPGVQELMSPRRPPGFAEGGEVISDYRSPAYASYRPDQATAQRLLDWMASLPPTPSMRPPPQAAAPGGVHLSMPPMPQNMPAAMRGPAPGQQVPHGAQLPWQDYGWPDKIAAMVLGQPLDARGFDPSVRYAEGGEVAPQSWMQGLQELWDGIPSLGLGTTAPAEQQPQLPQPTTPSPSLSQKLLQPQFPSGSVASRLSRVPKNLGTDVPAAAAALKEQGARAWRQSQQLGDMRPLIYGPYPEDQQDIDVDKYYAQLEQKPPLVPEVQGPGAYNRLDALGQLAGGVITHRGGVGAPVPGFYSKLEETLNQKMPGRAAPEQILNLARGAVKAEEFTNLENALRKISPEGSPISKADMLRAVREETPQLTEVTRGEPRPELLQKVEDLKRQRDDLVGQLTDQRDRMVQDLTTKGLDESTALELADSARYGPLSERTVRDIREAYYGGPGAAPNIEIEFRMANTMHQLRDAQKQFDTIDEQIDALKKAAQSGSATRYAYDNLITPGGTNQRELLMMLKDPRQDRLEAINARMHEISNSPAQEHANNPMLAAEWNRLNDERKALGDRGPTPLMSHGEGAGYAPQPRWGRGHWQEPDVFAHGRYNDRVGPNGEKILHIEEIQSDWHQRGREEGYQQPFKPLTELPPEYQVLEVTKVNRLHQFGTYEEQTAAVKRHRLAEEAYTSYRSQGDYRSPGDDPTWQRIQDEHRAARQAMSATVPGWGKADYYDLTMSDGSHREWVAQPLSTGNWSEGVVPRYSDAPKPGSALVIGPGMGEERHMSARVLPSAAEARAEALQKLNAGLRNAASAGVPDAPFKKNWHELVLKRILKHAVENGYDQVTWTTGAQQAERYNLATHLRSIAYSPENELLRIQYREGGRLGGQIGESQVPRDQLHEHIGQELTDRLFNQPTRRLDRDSHLTNGYVLEGEDLSWGGEGMKGFYDKMIPSFLNNYAKKWGARVGEQHIQTDRRPYKVAEGLGFGGAREFWVDNDTGQAVAGPFATRAEATKHPLMQGGQKSKVHMLPITPKMREEIRAKGQPLYMQAPIGPFLQPQQPGLGEQRQEPSLGLGQVRP